MIFKQIYSSCNYSEPEAIDTVEPGARGLPHVRKNIYSFLRPAKLIADGINEKGTMPLHPQLSC